MTYNPNPNPEQFFNAGNQQPQEQPPWLKQVGGPTPEIPYQATPTVYTQQAAPAPSNYAWQASIPGPPQQTPSYGPPTQPQGQYQQGQAPKKPKHFTLRATTPKDPKWGPGLSASITPEGAQELGRLLQECGGDLRRLRFSVMIYDKLLAEVKQTGQGYGVKPVGGGFFGLKKEYTTPYGS